MKYILSATIAIFVVIAAAMMVTRAIQPTPMEPSSRTPRFEASVRTVDACEALEVARKKLSAYRNSAADCNTNSDCAYAKGRCLVPVNILNIGEYEKRRAEYLEFKQRNECEIIVDYVPCFPPRPNRILECVSGMCQEINVELHESIPLRN